MSTKSDNLFKTITVSVIWLSVGFASIHLGFFTLGMALIAFLATLAVVEA